MLLLIELEAGNFDLALSSRIEMIDVAPSPPPPQPEQQDPVPGSRRPAIPMPFNNMNVTPSPSAPGNEQYDPEPTDDHPVNPASLEKGTIVPSTVGTKTPQQDLRSPTQPHVVCRGADLSNPTARALY